MATREEEIEVVMIQFGIDRKEAEDMVDGVNIFVADFLAHPENYKEG